VAPCPHPSADDAFKHACKMVEPGDELKIVNVVPSVPVTSEDPFDVPVAWVAPDKDALKESESLLERYRQDAKASGVVREVVGGSRSRTIT